MNALEHQLSYPFGDTLPEVGTTLEIAPGVRWLRMKLPFALDHINLWLLRDEIDGRAGWTVVDCCISRDEARAQWEQVFATQLGGLPILRVIVTHMRQVAVNPINLRLPSVDEVVHPIGPGAAKTCVRFRNPVAGARD